MLATGMGVGFSPFAPGTIGALWGVLIVRTCYPHLSWKGQILFSVLAILLAVPVCDVGEKALGVKDPRPVVADEYLTFPLCMIGLPANEWWMLGVAFVTHRAMDILKPPPARRLQALQRGVGIVIDDAISSLYSLAVNWLVFYLIARWKG